MDKDKLEKFKEEMRQDMETYTNDGKNIKIELIQTLMKHNVSPIIAHIILSEIIEAIEEKEPAIKMAKDMMDNLVKKYGKKEDE